MKEIRLRYRDEIEVTRDEHGVPHVVAKNQEDLYFGQGFMQAYDRGVQMTLMRILAQGRASELLRSSDDVLEFDIFFRRMNWSADLDKPIPLGKKVQSLADAWCEGINVCLRRHKPFEFFLIGYTHEEWKISDAILMSRLISYIGLQQTQADVERFLIELVQSGVPNEFLHELFPGGVLDGMDYDLISRVRLSERSIPVANLFGSILPRMTGSNNWAISPKRSESGRAMLASDPHQEGNRLPNIWQEICLSIGERYMMGGGIPGLPGIWIGRNNDLAWGATYSCMDGVDSWIEECREGKFWRGTKSRTEWIRFHERREVIKRKRKKPLMITFYENEHGVLDGNPVHPGYYLTTRWAPSDGPGIDTVESAFSMFETKGVAEGMELFGKIETPWNWVLADAEGSIGYQMSGLMPRRPPGVSGLYPLPGWDAKNDWKEFHNLRDLPRKLNPREGFIATTNNDLNKYGRVHPINVAMDNCRIERIQKLIQSGGKVNLKAMTEMQYDTYAPQAERFLKILEPLLPEGSQADTLRSWDRRYTQNSKGAQLFEGFYRCLVEDVFGAVLGQKGIRTLMNQSYIFPMYFHLFDRILLSEKSAWFRGRTRGELYAGALKRALEGTNRPAQHESQVELRNLFAGSSPLLAFMNRKAVPVPGGRSSLHQFHTFQKMKRDLRILPVYRFVMDFSVPGIFSNMLGGPSERPFSRWYNSDVKNWVRGLYRHLLPFNKE
jgi:penicillin amidase